MKAVESCCIVRLIERVHTAPTTPAVTRTITILVEGSVADNPFLKLGVDGANEACTAVRPEGEQIAWLRKRPTLMIGCQESNCCLRVYQLVTGFTTWGATCAVRACPHP
eukprot:3693460-Rhodomonas_salina.1